MCVTVCVCAVDTVLSVHPLWTAGYWLPSDGVVHAPDPQPEPLVRRAQAVAVAGRELAGLTDHVHLRRWEMFIEVRVSGEGGDSACRSPPTCCFALQPR
jgi:hypothetical protein